MTIKSLRMRIYRFVIRNLPKNDFGDRVFALIHFYGAHGRMPKDDFLLSDYLYKTKLSDQSLDPLRGYVSDKEFVKNYVTAKIGAKYNVPTIKVLHNMSDVRAFKFPERCCIKPTHLSGVVILRENGEDIDFDTIEDWFVTNYYDVGRERNYRYLKPKIIVEPLIFDTTDNEDLKFFCYRGKAKFVQIDLGRHIQHTRLYFDRAWTKQQFSMVKPMSKEPYERPENYGELLELADKLSADFESIRVDFYTNGDQIYVGELTNWHENANGYFVPKEGEKIASELLFRDL